MQQENDDDILIHNSIDMLRLTDWLVVVDRPPE